MTLAFKFLNSDGACFHGGTGNWHLPDENGPGDWFNENCKTDAPEHELYLCRRKDLCLWVGPALFVTEFKGIIREEKDCLVVLSARILKKIDDWNEKTKTSFGTKCYEHILSDDKLIQSANLENIELLTSAYEAKNFIVIPRIARSLAINIDSEIEWQNRMLWKYVEEEILDSFTEPLSKLNILKVVEVKY